VLLHAVADGVIALSLILIPAGLLYLYRRRDDSNPREASLMSAFVTVVLFVPQYFMIAGVTVLALAFMKIKSEE